MSRAKPKPTDPEAWPTTWRVVFVPPDAEPFEVASAADLREARRQAVELRRLGWPVRVERVSVQPLPARALKRLQRIEEAREAESATRH